MAAWTEAQDTILTLGWRSGLSSSELMFAPGLVGRSRSAILGRIYRLGLMGQGGSAQIIKRNINGLDSDVSRETLSDFKNPTEPKN